MDEKIRLELEQEEHSAFHSSLLSKAKSLTKMSRDEMSKRYSAWDLHHEVYKGERQPDKQDVKADERGEPIKMVVPLSFAQIQTFAAFQLAMFLQRDHIFEVVGMGEEDHSPAKLATALLDRDLKYNRFLSLLHQWLIDIGRFGVGVFKTGWLEKLRRVREPQVQVVDVAGQSVQQEAMAVVERVEYQGNGIWNVSPYHFFPDPRFPLGQFQDGEFVASESEVSIVKLYQMQHEGVIAGVRHVEPLRRSQLEDRGETRLKNVKVAEDGDGTATLGTALLTEIQMEIVPSQYKLDNGKPLGEEDFPQKWNVWYVNDNRVVKAEPLGYLHGMYTYDVAEYSPDMHEFLGDGIAGKIERLQDVITWLVNSRVTSVRKTLDNKIIVDPAGIEMKDIQERRPVIRMKPDRAGQDVRKFVQQLDMVDVTAGHFGDVQALQDLTQVVTGINENALGQFHAGRRSATEARNVNNAFVARSRTSALLGWESCLEPLGKKLLFNLQDGLTEATFVAVAGELANPLTAQQFQKVTRADIVGNFDFKFQDGTLPSEQVQRAQALQELLLQLASNPESIPALGYDPVKLVEEWLELRGIRHPKRFKLTPVRMQELLTLLQQYGGLREPGLPINEPAQLAGKPNGQGSTGRL